MTIPTIPNIHEIWKHRPPEGSPKTPGAYHVGFSTSRLLMIVTREAGWEATCLDLVVWAILHRFHLFAFADHGVVPHFIHFPHGSHIGQMTQDKAQRPAGHWIKQTTSGESRAIQDSQKKQRSSHNLRDHTTMQFVFATGKVGKRMAKSCLPTSIKM